MEEYNANGDATTLSFIHLPEKELENGLKAAMLYTRKGLPVVPCKGKAPILKNWPELRLGLDDLPLHFGDGRNNIGLILGEPSEGLVVADIDVPEALKVAERFFEDTLRGGRTSRPRAHLYYRVPGLKNKKWQDTDGAVLLELRSTGCQMLVEPSIHVDTGEPYAWDRDSLLEPIELDANELEQRCTELATATIIARHLPPIGGRHEYAKAVIGYLLRRLEEEVVLGLVLAAWHAGDGDSEEALRDLKGIVEDTARRLSEGDNVFEGPTLEEMAPSLPKLLGRWWGWENRERGEKPVSRKYEKKAPTHVELGDRWAEANPGHAYGLGEWKRYERGLFSPASMDTVKRQIVETLEAAKGEGVRPTAWLLASVLELARVKLAVPDEEWDADTDILVCRNGVLHIPTGELRPHSPQYHATSGVPYDFDENAAAPTWERFLKEFVDAETACFLQEFAGLTLTTDVSHEIALWLCGPPGGGRSTFIAGLETMLGEKVGTLGLGEIERSRFALADVPGKTLLTATEQPAGYLRASDILNALISGDKLKVERKFKDAFDFFPKAKLLWAMNDVPRIPSANDGLFRRVKVIEIASIPEDERVPEVKQAIRGEGAGILVWALEGLQRLRARGRFEIPTSVRAATEQFRLTNDVPALFVQEACSTHEDEDRKEQSQDLYSAYKRWCLINGHKPLSSTKIASEWRRLGFGERQLHGASTTRGSR